MYALMSAAAYMFHDINECSISQSSSRFSFTCQDTKSLRFHLVLNVPTSDTTACFYVCLVICVYDHEFEPLDSFVTFLVTVLDLLQVATVICSKAAGIARTTVICSDV